MKTILTEADGELRFVVLPGGPTPARVERVQVGPPEFETLVEILAETDEAFAARMIATHVPGGAPYLIDPSVPSGSPQMWSVDWRAGTVTMRVSTDHIDAERDRRLKRFRFNGVDFDFDATSRNRIETNRNSAGWAIVAGKEPGDLRWGDPNIDFGWIAADNTFVTMDAPTALAFGNAAAAWEGKHIVAARLLKDTNPIPEDYADDRHWPA